MTTLTLDFETFYDSGFSLTNLATAEYVGDEKFAVMATTLAVGGFSAQEIIDGLHLDDVPYHVVRDVVDRANPLRS